MLWSKSFLGDASMTFRNGRQLVFPALVVAAVAAGCSAKPATAKAYVLANLSTSLAHPGMCNFGSSMPIVEIGIFDKTMPLTDSNPKRVNDGTTQQGRGGVTLDCTVHPSGSTFNVALSAQDENTTVGGGGGMTVTANGVDPSTGATNVTGNFSFGGVQYRDTNCTITYTFNGSQISLANNAPKVAAGRVWAHIDCPNASSQGSGQNNICDANADFVFENCGG
jgi:hypothetical protein